MSTAIDANVLVVRTNSQSPHHEVARTAVRELIRSNEIVYVFWPTIVAYLRVVTVPGVLRTPLLLSQAFANVEDLLRRPRVRTGGEGREFFTAFRTLSEATYASGKFIHDAHLVALMRQHGVGTVWTNDRDFRRFDGIRVVDPFAASAS